MSAALHIDRAPAADVRTNRAALVWALVLIDLVLILLVIQQTVTGWHSNELFEALAPRLLIATSFPLAGLWVVRHAETRTFGILLLALGVFAAVAMLTSSATSDVYTFGRFAVLPAETAIVYLVLAYPTGRLQPGLDRWLVAAAVALTACAWVPSFLVSPDIGAGGALVRCGTACPHNALLVSSRPDLGRALAGLALLGLLLVMVGVLVSLSRRFRAASPVRRRGLAAVTAASAVYAATLALFAISKTIDPNATVTLVFAWMAAVTVAVVPIGVMVALLRERLFANQVMLLLLRDLDSARDAREFRQAVRVAVSDPTLLFAHGDGTGTLFDLAGEPIVGPRLEGRATTVIEPGPTGLVLVHDPALQDDPRLFGAVRNAIAVAWEQSLQRDRVRALLSDVRESRARLAQAQDTERRRIERDLHDGAQQRLVAVRVHLGVARGYLEPGSPAEQVLDRVDADLSEAVSQLRDLARGIYPPVLESDGLAEALRAATQHPPLPTALTTSTVGRYDATLEAAVYFSCIEALQNSAKHAGDGARIDIHLEQRDGSLLVRVSDSGQGFDRATVDHANGLLNIRDRIESVGGSVEIISAPQQGTTVAIAVPVDPLAAE